MLKKKILGKNVVVIINGKYVDVFWGNDGWNPHCRFLKTKDILHHTGGVRPPIEVMSIVVKEVF